MPQEYEALKSDAISKLSSYMDSLDSKHGKILAYWIRDYVRFLEKEKTFDPQKLIRYKRGAIVKVHLGYRIGSEEGGLHYAVVIDDNPQKSHVATIIPLTSLKPTTDLANLHPSRVYLGDEIFQKLNKKLNDTIAEVQSIREVLYEKLTVLMDEEIDTSAPDANSRLAQRRVSIEILHKEVDVWAGKLLHAEKMKKDIGKMKRGSIALVNQITTISKIRIYDPLFPSDTLSNIRLSAEALDKLDEKIKQLYTGNT